PRLTNPIYRACSTVIYACGLRAGEATTLEIAAIDGTNRLLRIIGKRNKERIVLPDKSSHSQAKSAISIALDALSFAAPAPPGAELSRANIAISGRPQPPSSHAPSPKAPSPSP